MATWTEEPAALTLADLVSSGPRSAGLHLSDIYGDIMRTLEPDRFSGDPTPEYLWVGLAFEDLLARALRARLGWETPGEFQKDGIWISPDGLSDGRDGFDGIEEVKATWVSSREGLDNPKLARYHLQGKGYAYALGVEEVRYWVLWVNGDYAPPVPRLRVYRYIYTPRELTDNWAMLVQHAKDRGMK